LSLNTPFEELAKKLAELERSQEALVEKIHLEGDKLSNVPEIPKIVETLSKVGSYQQKVVQLRKNMTNTSERVANLRKKAEKMQAIKQKEELIAAQKREKEFEKERQLMAQPASSLLEQQPDVLEEETTTPSLSNLKTSSTNVASTSATAANTNTPQTVDKPAEAPKQTFSFAFRKKSSGS